MRITLILFAFICLQLSAQDENKSALTAGSEFLEKNEGQNKSITLNETMICPFDVITKGNDEYIAQLPQSVEIVSSKNTNPTIYLIAILLFAFAIHFFLSKKEAVLSSQINLKDEDEDQRKKELWDALSKPEPEE